MICYMLIMIMPLWIIVDLRNKWCLNLESWILMARVRFSFKKGHGNKAYWHQSCMFIYLPHGCRLNTKQIWQVTLYMQYSVFCQNNLYQTNRLDKRLCSRHVDRDRWIQLNVTIIWASSHRDPILPCKQIRYDDHLTVLGDYWELAHYAKNHL